MQFSEKPKVLDFSVFWCKEQHQKTLRNIIYGNEMDFSKSFFEWRLDAKNREAKLRRKHKTKILVSNDFLQAEHVQLRP